MPVTKLSISLDERTARILEEYKISHQTRTNSEVIEKALLALHGLELQAQYEDAYREWEASGEQDAWDAAAGDGLGEHGARE